MQIPHLPELLQVWSSVSSFVETQEEERNVTSEQEPA